MDMGTVPQWIEALAICALAVEVYIRWHRDPERPIVPSVTNDASRDVNPDYKDVDGPW